ncbi:MAG: site-specific integrase [Acidobacteriaceae bacterium]
MTTDLIEKYRGKRLDEKAARATINHEVGTLRRMYRYGKRSTPPTVHSSPQFPMFQLDNARQGFVEEGQFDRMADEAAKEGLWLRLLIEVAYTIGWRRGELLELRVRQIDLRKCVLRLDPGTTKNKKGREVQLDEQKQSSLLEFLRNACDGKKAEDYVFTRKVDDKQIP